LVTTNSTPGHAGHKRMPDLAQIHIELHKPGVRAEAAKVEMAVQRWILARLRIEQCFSLPALIERIAELLAELNSQPMRTYGGVSRRELFETLDRPAL
jgi:hypothetical protein